MKTIINVKDLQVAASLQQEANFFHLLMGNGKAAGRNSSTKTVVEISLQTITNVNALQMAALLKEKANFFIW